MLSLVIGGAGSGKSRYAQSLCANAERVVYIATARDVDAEMAGRIRRHRENRPSHWTLVEEPLEIASAVERHAGDCDFVLLDCLTLWLGNLCWEQRETAEESIQAAAMRELARLAAASTSSQVIVVTNEVGCGLVPDTPLGRFFRDLQGRVNQEAARLAGTVYHVVAGIALTIKQPDATRTSGAQS
jgi:adenosylcobinamide kinase/adenosylcobinamide-phosphate guanylyltransferase